MCPGYIFITLEHWKHFWGYVCFEVWARSVFGRYTGYLRNTATICKREWGRCVKIMMLNNASESKLERRRATKMEKGGVCSLAIFDKRPLFWSEVMHQLWFCFLMQISCPQHCGRKYIMAWEHASKPENWNRHINTENKQYYLFAGFPDFKAILIIFQGCNLGSRILGVWGWWHLCGRFEIKEVGWT